MEVNNFAKIFTEMNATFLDTSHMNAKVLSLRNRKCVLDG